MPKVKHPKRSENPTKRRRATQEDRLYALASTVSRACDVYFLRKGITPDFPSAWTRKIDYLGED
jgi:hypothetical protein